MYELNQYNLGDTVLDREQFYGKYNGTYRSIGVAQLRSDNVRSWVPSMAGASDKEIRPKLIDPEQSVELLAEAMSFWNAKFGGGATRAEWMTLDQAAKENKAEIFATAKDALRPDYSGWGTTYPAATIYAVNHGLLTIQQKGLLQ
ncbi:MAG: hypothetical protein Aurels2KO_05850 [Aureliella sp.]